MGLLDEVRNSLGISTDARDPEIQLNIDAAKRDMERAGVSRALLFPSEGDEDGLVRMAVVLWCKARVGRDIDQNAFWQQAYRRTVIDMVNSPTIFRDGGGSDVLGR